MFKISKLLHHFFSSEISSSNTLNSRNMIQRVKKVREDFAISWKRNKKKKGLW